MSLGSLARRTVRWLVPFAALLAAVGCGPRQETTAPPPPPTGNAPDANAPSGGAPGAAAPRDVTLIAREFRFEPAEITARPGETLRVTVRNEGSAPHSIEFELPAGEQELEPNVAPGGAGTLEITAPQQPGRYTFYCPVGNHHEQGMAGTLVVQEAGQR